MPISLSGMASGLDTESIITQLMAIEQNKVTAVQRRQISVTQHKTDLTTIKTKLDAVKTAAADLSSASTWKPVQASTSSDPTKVDVTMLAGAGIGGHSIQVDKLASSAQHGFAYTPSTDAGALTLFYGTDPAATGNSKVSIAIPANATATELATLINANEGAPVYAAVVKDGATERLVFSARKTGENSNFTVDASAFSTGGAALTEDTNYTRVGAATLNASYRLDGDPVAKSSESNVIESAIPGVRLTLKGISSSPVSVNTTQPAVDTDAITKKITALVDAYNAVVTATRSELTEKRIPTATTSTDLQKGQLFGDSGMNSMLSGLKNTMTQLVSGLGLTGLSDIGIGVPKSTGGTITEDAKAGKLTVDTTKLDRRARGRLHEGPRHVRGRRRHQGPGDARLGLRRHADRHQRRPHGPDEAATTRRSRASRIADRQAQHADGDRAEASQGPVRGHGDGAQQLPDAAGLAHEPDLKSPSW